MIYEGVVQKLEEFRKLVLQLSDAEYSQTFESLGGSSIGGHVRHVIEMLQCLEAGYHFGQIDYSARKRSLVLETDGNAASAAIDSLLLSLRLPNRDLELICPDYGEARPIATNYNRELLYNLEHAVHHQALIRVALRDLPNVAINADFGVAKSTLQYKQQCAR